MEPQPWFVQTCVCNRSFNDLGAFTRHGKICKKRKRQLGDALLRAKELYTLKKQRLKTNGEAIPSHESHSVATSHHESQSIGSSGEQYRNGTDTQGIHRKYIIHIYTIALFQHTDTDR